MPRTVSISRYLERLGSSEPSPGGGSASALAAALGAAELEKCSRIGQNSSRLRGKGMTLKRIQKRAASLKKTFESLVEEDASAYGRVILAIRKSRDDSGKARLAHPTVQRALKEAVATPMAICERSLEAMKLAQDLPMELSEKLWSDIGAGLLLLSAAFRSGALFVTVNLESLHDDAFVKQTIQLLDPMEKEERVLSEKLLMDAQDRISSARSAGRKEVRR